MNRRGRLRVGRARTGTVVVAMTLVQVGWLAGPATAACHIAGFNQMEVEVEEGAGEVSIAIVLQGGQPSCEGTVDVATQDGSASAGSDYDALSTTLTFTSGDDREEILTIPILADEEDEGDEDFLVVLSNPTGSISGTSDPATVTIKDTGGDDEPADDEPTSDDSPAASEPADDATTAPPDDEAEDADDDGTNVLLIVLGIVLVLGVAAFFLFGRRERA